jgi:dienelactone hydrolase
MNSRETTRSEKNNIGKKYHSHSGDTHKKEANTMKRSPIIPIVVVSIVVVLVGSTPSKENVELNSVESPQVESRLINIWSDGTRLSGNLFFPKSLKVGEKLPAVILCHGWGGVRAHLNQAYAPHIAAAGYVVLTFDYRGWGDSDCRLILRQKMPEWDKNGEAVVRVQAVRMLVDPMDQTEDIINCIDFIVGEQNVDTEQIGLWGTSYGGGHVLYVAAHDERVKCIVSQVPSMDSRGIPLYLKRSPEKENTQRARGEIDPVPQGFTAFDLPGTPYVSRMANYAPVEFASQLKIPMLVIVAEKEELMDNKVHGLLAYNRAKDNVPAKYEVMKGLTHFDIYAKGRMKAINLAVEWLNEHLK